jgi:hypothetical protein
VPAQAASAFLESGGQFMGGSAGLTRGVTEGHFTCHRSTSVSRTVAILDRSWGTECCQLST